MDRPLRLEQWRCRDHLPSSFEKSFMDRDPCYIYEIYEGGNVASYARYKPHEKRPPFVKKNYCAVCAFKSGIEKVTETFNKVRARRVFDKMWIRWVTPRPDGTCPYAEWSWRKMREELECNGVQF